MFFDELTKRKLLRPLALEDLYVELNARTVDEAECVAVLKWWLARVTRSQKCVHMVRDKVVCVLTFQTLAKVDLLDISNFSKVVLNWHIEYQPFMLCSCRRNETPTQTVA